MACRRRDPSSCSSFSTFLITDLVCFKERTSFNFLKFAQSRRRRFTASSFGVSLLASDADLLRVVSLPLAAVGGYSSEPSDLKSNGESLALVASDPGSSQIWRACVPTSAILLVFVGRDPFPVFTRRPYSTPACCSGYHIPIPHRQPSSAASTLWFISRHCLHSHAAGRILRLQVLSQIRVLQIMGQIWVLQITGRLLALGLMGLMDQKAIPISQQPTTMIAQYLCRCRLRSRLVFFNCFNCSISHQIALQEVISATPTTPGLPCDLLQDVRSGFVRAKQQTGALSTVWSLAPTTPGLPCDLLQDVRLGFVRAQETLSPPSPPKRGTLPSIFMSKMSSKSLVKLTNLMSVEENSLKTVSTTGLRVLGCIYNSPDDLSNFLKFVSLSLSYACCNVAIRDWSFMAFYFVIGLIE